jgi:hypothetical protein
MKESGMMKSDVMECGGEGIRPVVCVACTRHVAPTAIHANVNITNK